MPIYTWKCNTCKKEVDVLRNFEDYKKSPGSCYDCGTDDWEKLISEGIKVARGDNWGGGKGNW